MKRTSRRPRRNGERQWYGVWTGKTFQSKLLASSPEEAIEQFLRKTRGMVFVPGGALRAEPVDAPPARSAPTPLPHWKVSRNPSSKLDKQDRAMINESLIRRGFDGNGRFRSIGAALSAAADVLSDYGLEPDEVFSAWRFDRPSGNEQIHVAHSNPDDPFSPVPVENSVLAFSWYQHGEGKWEALAYMS